MKPTPEPPSRPTAPEPPPAQRGIGLLFWLAAISLGLLGLLTIVSIFHDRAELSPAWQETMDVVLSPWSLTTYAACTCLVLVGAWYLARVRNLEAQREVPMPPAGVLTFLVLLVGTIAAAGYLLSRDIDEAFREEQYDQQQGIARLKVGLIDQWVQERLVDLQFVVTSLRGFPAVAQPDVRELTELVFAQMLAGPRGLVAVALIGADGKPVLSTGLTGLDVATALEAPLAALAARARQAQSAVVQSLIVQQGGVTRVLVVAARPIAPAGPNAGLVVTMLNDPTVDLLREVEAWPADSATSHVLVAQQDGQNLVYLVPVPGLSQKPFLRLPLATPNLNSAKAFLHGDFVHEGTDFRGIPVLVAARKVAALPWVVVAKTETAEAMAPLGKRMRRIGLIFGGAILVSIVLVFAVWRGQRAALAATVRHYEDEREAMSHHANALVRQARDAILLIGADGHIVEANAAAEALYGYSGAELARLSIRDLRVDDDSFAFDHQWAAASTPEGTLFEAVHRRKDGTPLDVEVSSRSIDVGGRTYHQSFIRDISRRKVLERQVERLLRIERALQVTTGVLLRSTSEQELYQRMCGVVVDIAGYRMAFVALANDDPDRTVTLATVAGHEAGFFAVRGAITWAEGDTSVTGTAIRTGEIQVNQDYATNPNVAGSRDEALKRGFHSSISLPIREGTRVIGALSLASAERHAFNAQEVGLLATLADDVSYGVAALRNLGRGDGN